MQVIQYVSAAVPTSTSPWQVSFNPQDNTQISVVGEKLFKLFRYSEGTLKQFAFMKADPLTYLCQAWISEDRLVLGSDSGRVQLFEVGELKNEFVVTAPPASQEASPLVSRKSMYVCYCVCVCEREREK